MAEISLKLKRHPVVPDFEAYIAVTYEDTATPLESGEFPETSIKIPIPEGFEASPENIEALMAAALEQAKIEAQEKANKKDLQAVLNPLLADYAESAPVEMFSGKVEAATQYVLETPEKEIQ